MEPTATMALRAARKAGDLIMRASDDMDRVGFRHKAAADYVTDVDIAAEKEILYHLNKAYPEHRFLCEESGVSGNDDSEYTWIIDPLDGTSNFMRGIPHTLSASPVCIAARLSTPWFMIPSGAKSLLPREAGVHSSMVTVSGSPIAKSFKRPCWALASLF